MKKKCMVSKWQPKNEFSLREKIHVTKIRKNHFPKEIFNQIWLKVEKHKYIKLFCFKIAAKTSFVTVNTKI